MSLLAGVDPDVAYPETVPEMAESGLHYWVRERAHFALRGHFAARSDCFVCSDRNLYYRRLPDSKYAAPDVFVCFGVDPGPLELAASYRLWESGAPSFVLEVASKRTRDKDLGEKRGVYLEMGVGEYWRFDPTGGGLYTPMLQGDRLAGGAWEPIEVAPDGGGLRGRSPALGLDLHAEAGRLRFKDPRTGLWLPDHEDDRRARDAAEDRAAAAEAACRAEAAARRAEAAARRDAEEHAAAAETARRAAEAELAALRARMNDQDGDTAR